MDYKKLLQEEMDKYEEKHCFQTMVAGDISRFRYPHMWEIEDNFKFDEDINSFILKDDEDSVLSTMAMNDIRVYELMNPTAAKLHLYDIFGYEASEYEKLYAYTSVRNDYLANKNNKAWSWPHSIKKVSVKDLKIKDEFEYLNTFINKSKDCDIYFYEFRKPINMFLFGSTLKGTNVAITDDNKANYYQELFHMIYHLEESIPGFNDDNMNILEIWSNPDSLYLKQLLEGRFSRRIRNCPDPHKIITLDYIFLKAYLGTAFAKEDEKICFHSAFSLIEPTIKLLMYTIPGNIKDKNKVIIDAICFNKYDELINSFDNVFGVGAYRKVFYDCKLFNRLNTIKNLCKERRINYNSILDIMFSEEELVPTIINNDVVKYIWENDNINQDRDLIISLVNNYSKTARDNNRKITMDNLKEYFGKTKIKKIK